MLAEERFWSRVEKSTEPYGCWLWQGSHLGEGYGKIYVDGRNVRIHRYAYELLVGPIPEGLQLDHLCRVRHCVNPAHLEPVTQQENILRGTAPTADNARKTHCPRGHALTLDNIRWNQRGNRECLACRRAWRKSVNLTPTEEPPATAVWDINEGTTP